MSVLSLFGRKAKDRPSKGGGAAAESGAYSGMRVEVTAGAGRLLFVAKLENVNGSRAELHQYSQSAPVKDEGSVRVKIRGYNDEERKAVYMEGVISPGPQHIWQVEGLTVIREGNDRAFFRLDTNIDATATMFTGLAIGERPCKLLNISVGGACISSGFTYHAGDKFMLKVKLMPDRPVSVMYCQVLRVIEKDRQPTQYGCRFLELTQEDEEKITQNIFAVQRQQRARSSR